MRWKESNAVSERMKFVARLLEGERMTDVCKDFGISRKTGYKIFDRYKNRGLDGLKDQSRAARQRPNQTPTSQIEVILKVRESHPTWGAPKIKAYLEKKHAAAKFPASSTIHAILARNDLILKKRNQKDQYRAKGTELTTASSPNDIWCADFKGQFKLGNNRYCYPLTASDRFSRFIIICEGLEAIDEQESIDLFDQAFAKYGLPNSILSDNGVPFASRSHYGLSKLSVHWLRLGIKLQRIRPGNPQENGSHERMHRTLKADVTRPPSSNFLAQQERFDGFKETYNFERPHQGIEDQCPAELYKVSERKFQPILDELEYPDDDYTLQVSKCGSIRSDDFRVYLGTPFAGENIGVTQVDDNIWQIKFMNYMMGFFDKENQKIQIPENPFLK